MLNDVIKLGKERLKDTWRCFPAAQNKRKSCGASVLMRLQSRSGKDRSGNTSTFWPMQELDTFHISDTVHI